MKCVCPMGGDRTCPDDCPLAVWANMPSNDRKTQRKPFAERLYKEGFTMEAIATQLGVSPMQISRDLESFNATLKPLRPKGGRPKSNKLKPERRKNMSAIAETAAQSIIDEGKSYAEIEKNTGLSSTVLRSAVAREEGRREAVVIDPESLSLTMREKLDAAIRQHKHKLDLQFEQRVLDGIRERIEATVLPSFKKTEAEYRATIKARKGAMDKGTFNRIRRCLHPDSRNSVSDKMLAEAFDIFMSLEKRLLDEKESATSFVDIPHTYEDLMKAKAAATAARRARRTQSQSSVAMRFR